VSEKVAALLHSEHVHSHDISCDDVVTVCSTLSEKLAALLHSEHVHSRDISCDDVVTACSASVRSWLL